MNDTFPHASSRIHTTLANIRSLSSAAGTLRLLVGGAAIALAGAAHAQDAVDAAATYQGVRYVYGGDSRNGIDCSALVRRAYRELQVELPRTSQEQFSYTSARRLSRGQLTRGDLVFFATDDSRRGVVSHVGIFIGGNQFIDANSAANRVQVDNIDSSYWISRFKGGGRVARDVTDGAAVLLRPWYGFSPTWRYLMAYGGGGGTVAGNSTNPWDWETWRMRTNGGGPVRHGSWVCLQARNGQYLSSDGSWKPATANRGGVGGWEWFQISREGGDGPVRSGDRIALQGCQGPFLGANFNYGDWSVGCWYWFGGYGGWETMTLVVK